MIGRDEILHCIPHQGTSCLIDSCTRSTATGLLAHTMAHLRSDNPLRFGDKVDPLVGAEMAMQAAALHATLAGEGQVRRAAGYLAALRDLEFHCDRLDRSEYGELCIDVAREQMDPAGMIYSFVVRAQDDEPLVSGHGIVMFRPAVASL
ncbi:phosphotransferase [Acidomonas methanolica]|uniref:phosphotransferase n=1 Tax=Acidomonas methanolica TaxID=437 RepID=UPI00211A2747|nr:phosphotransferase [Acidomonas methanolica]MCQ9154663.1 phosphotransferase [Acidomonas methanolica]